MEGVPKRGSNCSDRGARRRREKMKNPLRTSTSFFPHLFRKPMLFQALLRRSRGARAGSNFPVSINESPLHGFLQRALASTKRNVRRKRERKKEQSRQSKKSNQGERKRKKKNSTSSSSLLPLFPFPSGERAPRRLRHRGPLRRRQKHHNNSPDHEISLHPGVGQAAGGRASDPQGPPIGKQERGAVAARGLCARGEAGRGARHAAVPRESRRRK